MVSLLRPADERDAVEEAYVVGGPGWVTVGILERIIVPRICLRAITNYKSHKSPSNTESK